MPKDNLTCFGNENYSTLFTKNTNMACVGIINFIHKKIKLKKWWGFKSQLLTIPDDEEISLKKKHLILILVFFNIKRNDLDKIHYLN